MKSPLLYFAIHIILYWVKTKQSHTNFEIKRLEICNKTQGVIKYYGNISAENGRQYLTSDVTLPMDIDDNIGLVCHILSRTTADNFMELFVIREKNYCKAMHKFMGEVWYNLERASGLIPGMCPVRLGKYHVNHTLLDFQKMPLQTFPFGRLKLIAKVINNGNPVANLICLLIEIENHVEY